MSLNLGLGIGLPLGGGGFDPAALFTVSGSRGFLYDFSDYSTQFTDTAGTTAVTGTGAAVARVNDKSGLGNNATQTTAGNRPVTTEISGYRGIAFDGATSNRWLQTAAINFSNSDEVTVVAGVRKLSDAAGGVIVELGAPAIGFFNIQAPSGAGANNFGSNVRGSITGGANYSQISPSTQVYTITAKISTDSIIVRGNGTQRGTSASDLGTGNFANDIIYIGRRAGTSLPFNGVITFLFVINRILSASELTAMEAFANSRTGAF